jgi:hypothetical protein
MHEDDRLAVATMTADPRVHSSGGSLRPDASKLQAASRILYPRPRRRGDRI